MAKKVSGTKEWACKNVNIAYGCENGCKYCYAKKMHGRFKRIPIDGWTHPILKSEEEIFKNLPQNTKVMFPSTHDITPANLDLAINIIEVLLDRNNSILIVSKPRIECIRTICKQIVGYTDKIEFRFTIGSSNNERLKEWEPNASSFEERMACIREVLDNHYAVSISCEPLLDNLCYPTIQNAKCHDSSIYLIDSLLELPIEEIWIGAMNYYKNPPRLDFEAIYQRYNNYPKIKWKESFRKHIISTKKVSNLLGFMSNGVV